MPCSATTPDLDLAIEHHGGRGGGAPPVSGGEGGGDDEQRNGPRRPASPKRYFTGIALAIVSILMFFMALASAFLVRKGSGTDWVGIQLPRILWFNTLLLLTSSGTLEWARRRLALADVVRFRKLWNLTIGLGVLFLAGQVVAWEQLTRQGVFLASNPGSSFFYIFTAAHAAHLIGGVCALLYVRIRKFEEARISLLTAAEVASYYWHFMDALWLFLLALLYLGK